MWERWQIKTYLQAFLFMTVTIIINMLVYFTMTQLTNIYFSWKIVIITNIWFGIISILGYLVMKLK